MALTEHKVTQIRDYLSTVPEGSDVYIGCDSNRYKSSQGIWMASYNSYSPREESCTFGRKSNIHGEKQYRGMLAISEPT